MIELIKKTIDLWARARWLRCISKECDKYYASREKMESQRHIVNGLIDKYKEIYGEDLRKIRGDRDE